MQEIRRKIYRRGSSYETTLPMPIAFSLNESKQYNIKFVFDESTQKWYIEFEERRE